jgi:hypothetical protein
VSLGRGRLPGCLGSLGLAAGSVLLVLGLAEAGLRAARYEPERYKSTARLASHDGRLLLDCYPTDLQGHFDADLREAGAKARYLHLAPKRYDAVARRAPFAVEFRYNSLGLRGAEVPAKKTGVRRVVVVGDSFTEGQGVRESETYPKVLESLLEAEDPGQWEVVNCGKRATDFPALNEVFGRAVSLDPDVVVYAMVPNDPERSEEFEARQSYLNDWIIDRRRMLLNRPHFELGPFDLRVRALLEDRVESFLVARETTRWYKDMYGEANRQGWVRTRGYIRAMRDAAREKKAAFVLMSWPLLLGLDSVYPFEDVAEAIARMCAEEGIRQHDLLPVLRGRPPSSLWVHPVDMHPNHAADRLVAESLVSVVRGAAAEGPRP